MTATPVNVWILDEHNPCATIAAEPGHPEGFSLRIFRGNPPEGSYKRAIELTGIAAEALNIHARTGLKASTLLEQREALRSALEAINDTPIPMVQCPDTLKFVLRQIGKIASNALATPKKRRAK